MTATELLSRTYSNVLPGQTYTTTTSDNTLVAKYIKDWIKNNSAYQNAFNWKLIGS